MQAERFDRMCPPVQNGAEQPEEPLEYVLVAVYPDNLLIVYPDGRVVVLPRRKAQIVACKRLADGFMRL